MTASPFNIGADVWPGLGKASEEAGELVQVIAKLIATDGAAAHWDGTNLHDRLTEELADVLAAVSFVVDMNPDLIHLDVFHSRVDTKYRLFRKWHEEAQAQQVVPADPFTLQRRLCDDEGIVSEVRAGANVFGDLTYLSQINNLRAHTGLLPVHEPFACTGSAHLAGEHILCTSPAHE